MDFEELRKDFPVLQKKVDGKPIIYFDNAATSLKPRQVIEALNYYYNELNANVHRGLHKLSEESSQLYEDAHKKVAGFINAVEEELVFTKNTSESINLVMYSLLNENFFEKGDEVIVSRMEHHSNLVPWQFLEKKVGTKLIFVELNKDFTLNLDDLTQKVSSKTKLVAVTHASNTVASVVDVKEIAKIAHENNALFLVDAAQSVPHMPVDVKKIDADFLAFSGHKMCGPTGIGCLFGKKELLEKIDPFLFGGGMILSVKEHESTWNKLPYKFEAGTPHIAGGIGLAKAVDYLDKIGMENVRQREIELTKHLLNRIREVEKVKVYCPNNAEKQTAIVLFDFPSLDAHDLALALDEAENIAVRSGMHCAEPLVSKLNPKGLVRASLSFYNTKEEIDKFINALKQITNAFS